MTEVVGQECLLLMERFKGGILGEGHSWVSIAPPAVAPAVVPAAPVAHQPEKGTRLDAPASMPVALQPALTVSRPAGAPSAAELEVRILGLAACYIADVNPRQPLAAQGLDSLAALELRQQIQEATGLELMTLIEDPEGATIAAIVSEATVAAAAASSAAVTFAASQQDSLAATAVAQPQQQQALVVRQHAPAWISPAPFAVKMRLFCLPYAGGVSENVFAR